MPFFWVCHDAAQIMLERIISRTFFCGMQKTHFQMFATVMDSAKIALMGKHANKIVHSDVYFQHFYHFYKFLLFRVSV